MVIEVGQGPPLVLIPGIQGRWEYLRPAIDALSRTFRVLTFPLCGERGCDHRFDAALGYDNDARQVLTLLDRRGIERATICGISFGGLPAIRFAADHPDRSSALIVVSTPGPGWHLRPKHRVYARAPWLFGPLFLVESPLRLHREVAMALPRRGDRWRFLRWQIGAFASAPLSPARLARRAELIAQTDIVDDCSRVRTPTLIITGERSLDRVVPVEGTLGYLPLISGACHRTLERTGHLGSVTTPDVFAAMVREFVDGQAQHDPSRGWNRAIA